MSEIFRVPECNWERLEEKVEQLAKRAVKLGLVPPSLDVWHTQDVPLVYSIEDDAEQEKHHPGPNDDDHRLAGDILAQVAHQVRSQGGRQPHW